MSKPEYMVEYPAEGGAAIIYLPSYGQAPIENPQFPPRGVDERVGRWEKVRQGILTVGSELVVKALGEPKSWDTSNTFS